MTLILEVASWLCILLGSFFMIVGTLGLVRMPDVFTRMHAASVVDTLGVGFLFLGMGFQAGLSLITLKLLFLLALFFFTGPVVTHALAQACMLTSHAAGRNHESDLLICPSPADS